MVAAAAGVVCAKAGAKQQAPTRVAARFLYKEVRYMALKKENPRRWGRSGGGRDYAGKYAAHSKITIKNIATTARI